MAINKLPRGAAMVGAGMCKFGAFADKSSRDLFVEAFRDMRASVDKGFDPRAIETVYIGNYSSDLFEGQGHLAPILADAVGLTPRPATRVEDACASGGAALRQGVLAIASGMYDVALVGGVECMTKLPTEKVTDTLGTAGDTLYSIPLKQLRGVRDLLGLQNGLRELFVPAMQSGSHQACALVRDTIEPTARDLFDQAMPAQLGDVP